MLDKVTKEPLPGDELGEFANGLWLPHYQTSSGRQWSVRRIAMAAARGYWGKVYPLPWTVVLTGPGRDGPASWMSLTPSEIESQTIGLAAAAGHTVVLGLGMGWLAANAALKPEVTHVTVVERNADVLCLIEEQGVFAQLPKPAREKIEIVKSDAFAYHPSEAVDSLQADIWERFTEDQKLDDMRRLQDGIGAKALYFWGQEMEIWRAALRRGGTLDWPLLRVIAAEDIALPLIVPDWPDYPAKIAAAAAWWFKPGWRRADT